MSKLHRWFKYGLAGKQRDSKMTSQCPSQSRQALYSCLPSAGLLSIVSKPGTPIGHKETFTPGRYEAMLK